MGSWVMTLSEATESKGRLSGYAGSWGLSRKHPFLSLGYFVAFSGILLYNFLLSLIIHTRARKRYMPKTSEGQEASVYDGVVYRINPDPGTSELEQHPEWILKFDWNPDLQDEYVARHKAGITNKQTARIPAIREPLTDMSYARDDTKREPSERYPHLRQFLFSGIEVRALPDKPITHLVIAFPGVNDMNGVGLHTLFAIDPPNGSNDMSGVEGNAAQKRGPYLEHTARWLRGMIPEIVKRPGWGVVTLTNFQSCEHMDLAEAQIACLIQSIRQRNIEQFGYDDLINVVFMGHSSGGLTATRMANHAMDGKDPYSYHDTPMPGETGIRLRGVILVDAYMQVEHLSERFRWVIEKTSIKLSDIPLLENIVRALSKAEKKQPELFDQPFYGILARAVRDAMRPAGRRPGRDARNIEKMVLGLLDAIRFVQEVADTIQEESNKLGSRIKKHHIGTHYLKIGDQADANPRSVVIPEAMESFKLKLPRMTEDRVSGVSHSMPPETIPKMTEYLVNALQKVMASSDAMLSQRNLQSYSDLALATASDRNQSSTNQSGSGILIY